MSVLDMMLSQVIKKYHGLNRELYTNVTTTSKDAELFSYDLDCSAIQLLVVLCLLVGLFQIVMGKFFFFKSNQMIHRIRLDYSIEKNKKKTHQQFNFSFP